MGAIGFARLPLLPHAVAIHASEALLHQAKPASTVNHTNVHLRKARGDARENGV